MSWNEAYSSLVGSFANGDRLLKSKKEVEGCFKAADRKVWSVRRKDTLFKGDPRQVSSQIRVAAVRANQRNNSRPLCQTFETASSRFGHERAEAVPVAAWQRREYTSRGVTGETAALLRS